MLGKKITIRKITTTMNDADIWNAFKFLNLRVKK